MNFYSTKQQKMLAILNILNDSLFKENSVYFAGGSFLSLDLGEYRQSNDIDFLCPVASPGYINIRNLIFKDGYEVLFKNLENVKLQRSTSDRYGIRMAINVDEDIIKLREAVTRLPWSSKPCMRFSPHTAPQ